MDFKLGDKYKFDVRANEECCGDNDYYVFIGDDKVLKIDLPEGNPYDVEGDKVYVKYPSEDKDGNIEWKKTDCYFKVKDYDEDIKKDVDRWDNNDSDSSDYSNDSFQWYNHGRDNYAEAKLKWKVKVESKIYWEDQQVGKVKLKLKGKNNCETWTQEEAYTVRDGDDERTEYRTVRKYNEGGRPKIAKIKAYWCGEEDDEPDKLKIEYEKKHWKEGNWDREWEGDDFSIKFTHTGWRGQCFVKTKSDNLQPLPTMLMGFLIGYYYHPQMISSKMGDKARSTALRHSGWD